MSVSIVKDALKLQRKCDIDCSEPILTDQSYKQACDINNIMAQYAKTGYLPQNITVPARYVDNTLIPSFEQSYEIVLKAQEAFYQLPADIRKLMDNDPSQLENFISDPANTDILVSRGVLVQREPVEPIKELKPATSKTE